MGLNVKHVSYIFAGLESCCMYEADLVESCSTVPACCIDTEAKVDR